MASVVVTSWKMYHKHLSISLFMLSISVFRIVVLTHLASNWVKKCWLVVRRAIKLLTCKVERRVTIIGSCQHLSFLEATRWINHTVIHKNKCRTLLITLVFLRHIRKSWGYLSSVWLETGRPWFDPRQRQIIFPLASVAHPASYPMGTGGPFPGGIARQGHDTDHSPPSSAGVENE
jgi:hypothetical protein